MSDGVATTLAVLQKTQNEAAVRVLVPALDSPDPAIQDGALKALLVRKNRSGHREILRRLPRMPARWRTIVRQHQGRLAGALRDAILGVDAQVCLIACEAAVWFQEYDLIPTLLNALDGRGRVPVEVLARTVLTLCQSLYDELAGPRDYTMPRDPKTVRGQILPALGESVSRYQGHRRGEVLEAYLLLAGRDDISLKKILLNPHHAAFLPIMDLLSKSESGGILRLLLSLLDDPHIPSSVLGVIAKRSDQRFVQHLLAKLGGEPSPAALQNLKKVQTVGWFHEGVAFLNQLDEPAQQGVVRLVMNSGVPRLQAFTVIQQLLMCGKPGGRRAAARALAEFSGADANALAVRAVDDPDPQVQAAVVRQLRRRGIPGVLPRMVELLDSPHAEVRAAARENLSEFTIQRFLAAHDLLDDEVRASTALLVKKADPHTVSVLRQELKSNIRSRRLRGLSAACAMDCVEPLEDMIIELLGDADHIVRCEAVEALGRCASPASRDAIEQAQYDGTEMVRQAATRSLHQHAAFSNWREALADPRD
ncbi:MAG: HEAT repeat domain-containing protein [Patescibacteria group bacterium]|nr:HEAT repeat domain-containing protein [Patescibacteria group bacterium]